MLRLLVFILSFFVFNALAGYEFTGGRYGSPPSYCAYLDNDCLTRFVDEIEFPNGPYGTTTGYRCSISGSRGYLKVYYSLFSRCASPQTTSASDNFNYIKDEEDGCETESSCRRDAESDCESGGQAVTSYDFLGANDYVSECAPPPPTPSPESCEESIIAACLGAHGGMATSNFTEDGLGGSSCSGTCQDGTVVDSEPEPEPDCVETPQNNFCDVPDPGNSDLDFGSGGSGSDVLPPSSSSGDVEHEIDYEPDGSTADSQTGMSTLQGDKLINEVVKSRNNNAETLVSTTDSTNQTIVEKSDDIQNTISNSANGIIDAINGIDTTGEPFNDGNIVGAIDGLGDKIDLIDDKLDGLTGPYDTTPTESGTYESLFDVGSIDAWKTKINILKVDIDSEMRGFEFDLKNTMSFTTTANGYAPNNLDLGQWGAHDISLSRFADYFGGVGNIIYFLASLTALSIVLGGIKL